MLQNSCSLLVAGSAWHCKVAVWRSLLIAERTCGCTCQCRLQQLVVLSLGLQSSVAQIAPAVTKNRRIQSNPLLKQHTATAAFLRPSQCRQRGFKLCACAGSRHSDLRRSNMTSERPRAVPPNRTTHALPYIIRQGTEHHATARVTCGNVAPIVRPPQLVESPS